MKTLIRFNAVGLAGVLVQLGVLNLLHQTLGVHYLAATALAVEAAVLHNYWWHWRWTWAGRKAPATSLLRFQFTTGVVSIAGNLFGMKLLVGVMGLPPLAANLAAIAILYAFNFVVSDRYVFRVR